MKLFLKKIGLFFVFMLAVNFTFNMLLVQKGNETFEVKANYINQCGLNNYDVFFFGSSRFFRHIIPAEFDSTSIFLRGKKSFNLGVPATTPPETIFLCEKYFNQMNRNAADTSTKYVFLELAPIAKIANENIFSRQNYYWLNFEYTKLAVNYFCSKNTSGNDKYIDASKYIFSYFIRLFGFNYISILKENILDEQNLGPNKDGYYSLEDNEKFYLKSGDSANYLTVNHRKLLQDSTPLYRKRVEVEKVFQNEIVPNNSEKIYAAKALQLIDELQKKNIHLIYVISLKLSAEDYEEVLALKQLLPADRVIEAGDPNKYPELWYLKNSFDMGHLNQNGSRIFTKILTDKFDSLLTK